MQLDPIQKCLDEFLDALSRNDEERLEVAMENLNIHYSGLTAPELYDQVLHAHTVLFTGTKEQIDKSVQKLGESGAIEDKLACLIGEMRESLTRRCTEEEPTIEKIYDIIGSHDEDYNNIWEALFTAAAKQKEQGRQDFVERVKIFLKRLDLHYDYGGDALKKALEVETCDILVNESPENRYTFILMETAHCLEIDEKFLDVAIALHSGSGDIATKYNYIISLYEKDNYNDLIDEIVMATHRHGMENAALAKLSNQPGLEKIQ